MNHPSQSDPVPYPCFGEPLDELMRADFEQADSPWDGCRATAQGPPPESLPRDPQIVDERTAHICSALLLRPLELDT